LSFAAAKPQAAFAKAFIPPRHDTSTMASKSFREIEQGLCNLEIGEPGFRNDGESPSPMMMNSNGPNETYFD